MRPQNILLLYKMSTYDYYRQGLNSAGTEIGRGDLRRFQDTHTAHYQSLDRVERSLSAHGLYYEKYLRGDLEDYSAFDMVISVGGDGTFLEAARHVQNQAVLGVNSDPGWSVGRLCSVTADSFDSYLKEILSDARMCYKLNRFKVLTESTGHTIHFLNDVLLAHVNPASLSRYILEIDGIREEQRGSGIWIASATGSTGAIHSAGGEILPLSSQDIQYQPRELYYGWVKGQYRFQGGVLSAGTRLRLTSLMAEGMLFFDGSHKKAALGVSETAEIIQSEYPLSVF